MKPKLKVLLCMLQIELAFSSFVLACSSFIDVRDNCAAYGMALLPTLFHDRFFVISAVVAAVFSVTSLLSLRAFAEDAEREGCALTGKQLKAILWASVAAPVLLALVLILLALTVGKSLSPLPQGIWLTVDLAVFSLINLLLLTFLFKKPLKGL